MLVKCRKCGKEIDRIIAYKVVVGKSNHYFCSKAEYDEMEKSKQKKADVYELINEIFGYKVINKALFKEIGEILEANSIDILLGYLTANKGMLSSKLNKDFSSEFARIRYFSAIIKNSINDYRTRLKRQNEPVKATDFEMLETNYSARPKRKGFADTEQAVVV